MLPRTPLLVLLALLALPASARSKGRPEPMTCPSDVPAALATACPCDGKHLPDDSVLPWRNHGQYVSCVARFRNTLRKAGCLTADLMRTVARCAARSTCGKAGTVLCCVSASATCTDPAPGDQTPGTCSTDAARPCTTDADCTTVRVHVTKDEATCVADGGTAGGAGSVCTACQPTTP